MSKDNIFEAIKDRVNHPFFGILLFSVILCNFEAFIVIFFGNMPILDAIEYVKVELINLLTLVLLPLFITFLYIGSSEWLKYMIDHMQTKPIELRYELQVKKEQKESELRNELRAIEKGELIEENELSKIKSETNKQDIDTYNKSKSVLPPAFFGLLKREIESHEVSKYVRDAFINYSDLCDTGEFVFKDDDAFELHKQLARSLSELSIKLEEHTKPTDDPDKYFLSAKNNAHNTVRKDILDIIDRAISHYNSYNTCLKYLM